MERLRDPRELVRTESKRRQSLLTATSSMHDGGIREVARGSPSAEERVAKGVCAMPKDAACNIERSSH